VVALVIGAVPATASQASPQLAWELRQTSDEPPLLYISRVNSGADHATTIVLLTAGAPTPVAPARIAVDVPKGYTMQFARPAGSPIGTGAFIQGDPARPASITFGSVRIADAAAVAADPAALTCDPDPHVGVWDLDLSATKGAPVSHVWIFVDTASASDPADAAYRLVLCPPAALDIGAFLLSLPPPILAEPATQGQFLWHALITPALQDGTDPDPTQTYEIRAVVLVPQSLSLHVRLDPKTRTATASGVATELGQPKAGLRVYLDADSAHSHAHLGPVTTDKAGRYSAQWAISETTAFTAYAMPADPGPCSTAALAPAGCLSQSVAVPPDETVSVKVPLRTDARRALKAADRAAAARITLKPSDFPAGWSSRAVGTDDASATCDNFHPDESRLTVTGSSQSALYYVGDFLSATFQAAASYVKVFSTPDQAKAGFAREAAMGQLQCVIDDAGEDYTVLGAGRIGLGKLGRVARGFRVVVKDNEGGTIYYLDLVVVLGKRSVVTLTLESTKSAPAFEQSLVGSLAARAARV
jgi:hypothetical protein